MQSRTWMGREDEAARKYARDARQRAGLVCPYCGVKLVRAHIEIEAGWQVVWVCGCEPDTAIVAEAVRVKAGVVGDEE